MQPACGLAEWENARQRLKSVVNARSARAEQAKNANIKAPKFRSTQKRSQPPETSCYATRQMRMQSCRGEGGSGWRNLVWIVCYVVGVFVSRLFIGWGGVWFGSSCLWGLENTVKRTQAVPVDTKRTHRTKCVGFHGCGCGMSSVCV